MSPALSQSANVSTAQNAALPVKATADNLQVNTDENTAVFTGNAKAVQGILDLRADQITLFFDDTNQNIKSVKAVGQVKFTNGQETAESEDAQLDVASQIITFSGSVILHQAQTVLTGDLLTYNITTNGSKMSGDVKTVFMPE
jgi:lipopolysaccharide export system protein LptA